MNLEAKNYTKINNCLLVLNNNSIVLASRHSIILDGNVGLAWVNFLSPELEPGQPELILLR